MAIFLLLQDEWLLENGWIPKNLHFIVALPNGGPLEYFENQRYTCKNQVCNFPHNFGSTDPTEMFQYSKWSSQHWLLYKLVFKFTSCHLWFNMPLRMNEEQQNYGIKISKWIFSKSSQRNILVLTIPQYIHIELPKTADRSPVNGL